MTLPKKEIKQLITGLVVFIGLLLLAVWLRGRLPYNWGTVVGLLPIFPAIFIGSAIASVVSSIDEFQQRVHLEALVFSLANTAFLCLLVGLLQAFGGSMEINLVWVVAIIAGFWGLGLIRAQRRYQ